MREVVGIALRNCWQLSLMIMRLFCPLRLHLIFFVALGFGQANAETESFKTKKFINETLAGYHEEDHRILDTKMLIMAYQNDWQLPGNGKISSDLIERLKQTHMATKSQWFKILNQDCELWNQMPQAQEIVSWDGDCMNGKAEGSGEAIWTFIKHGKQLQSKYLGDYKNGKQEGKGIFTWAAGNRYEGEYKDGKKHGYGIEIWTDGNRYEGEYLNGKQNGQGVFTWPDGSQYTGGYKNGKRHGQGIVVWANGGSYNGEYHRSKQHGLGLETWPSGDRYKGGYVNGKPHGQGTLIWASGDRYSGNFKEGKRHGLGRCNPKNTLPFNCLWEDGQFINPN